MFIAKSSWIRLAVVFAGAFLLVQVLHHSKSAAAVSAASGIQKPVVVELFTSEGCSSCPPADELLEQLSRTRYANGAEVIPLGFHVDYWDHLGWRDRFDSPEYSRRQEDYARTFHSDGPYTPQMVVNGETEFVGSDAGRLRMAILDAAREPAAAVVTLAGASGSNLLVKVKSTQPGDIMLAITEDNLTTKVGAGENGGHTLTHSAVVRELRRIAQLKGGDFSATAPIKVQQDWKIGDLRAVVFVQNGGSGKILGAATLPLKSLSGVN